MTDHSSDQRRDRSTTRRRLLRGGAAAAGAALAPTLAGRAAATETTAAPDKTIPAAIPADAPTFDKNNYVGLFLQVKERKGNVNPSGIQQCSFVRQGTAAEEGTYTAIDADKIWGYNAEIFKRRNQDTEGRPTTLFSLASNTSIGAGKIFIINNQQKCGDYVQVQLEQVGHSAVNAKSGAGAETAGTEGIGAAAGDDTTTATETSTPGFGVLTALGGIGAATAGALAARGDDDE